MLGLGVGEVIIILIVALVVLGPTKLPQVARQVGKGLREFRRHASDLQNTFDEVAREAEREERERERAAALGIAKTDTPATPKVATISAPDHPPLDMHHHDGGDAPQVAAVSPSAETDNKS
jgi:sec-independent protein translocase protein TatB